jgi:hypothetical protein
MIGTDVLMYAWCIGGRSGSCMRGIVPMLSGARAEACGALDAADFKCGDVMARGDVIDWHAVDFTAVEWRPLEWRPVECLAVGQPTKAAPSSESIAAGDGPSLRTCPRNV